MKGIIFTENIDLIMSGKKTQTRRAIKNAGSDWEFLRLNVNPAITAVDKNGDEYPKDVDGLWATFECDGLPQFPMIKSRYQIGDILWVREMWGQFADDTGHNYLYYKADKKGDFFGKWRPPIHMPRAAARIFLRVVDVRVERVQDISPEDAEAEGALTIHNPLVRYDAATYDSVGKARYSVLWDTINAKHGYGWDKNPWVWAITFERIVHPE